jgi:hypothetical protein
MSDIERLANQAICYVVTSCGADIPGAKEYELPCDPTPLASFAKPEGIVAFKEKPGKSILREIDTKDIERAREKGSKPNEKSWRIVQGREVKIKRKRD